MYTKSLIALVVISCVSADRDLPVLYSLNQPNHNVAVYRGSDLVKAQAAGLFGGLKISLGSGDSDSGASSYTTPAPPPPPPTTTTTAAPTTTTAAPTPAPVVYKPKPIVYKPAPVVYRPAPVVYKPAPPPVVYKPAPVVYKPAPAPIVYKPAPAPVAYKPAPAATYHEPEYAYGDAVYTWEYAVKDDYTSNDFGHKESRDGAHADGKYYVALPDGRLQTVTYTVDGYGGYVPVVEYSGEAQYPETVPYAPAPPAYQA